MENIKKLAFGTDHAATEIKETVKNICMIWDRYVYCGK
jgi:hypothetical protein